ISVARSLGSKRHGCYKLNRWAQGVWSIRSNSKVQGGFMGAVRGRSVTTTGASSVARRPRSPRVRRWSLLLIAGALLTIGLTSSTIAAGGPPIGRIYECYNYSSAFLNCVQALERKTRTASLVAPARKGNRLSGRAAKGTYKLRGVK